MRVLGEKRLIVSGGLDDGHPVFGERGIVEVSEIEKELEIRINDTRGVFRALDVTAHPIEAVGDATEHGNRGLIVGRRPCRWEKRNIQYGWEHFRGAAEHVWQAAAGWRYASPYRTHVSLLPP